jgi:hypothetical protein
MKNFLLGLLSVFILTMAFGISVLAQSDTVLNVGNVANQVTSVVQASAGHDLTWKIMFFAAIGGVIVRIIYTTVKGVKNSANGSPMQFAFSYWIKDNILPKITTLLAFILSTNIMVKLPSGIGTYIIFGALAFIGGLFIDWLTDVLKVISPQIK